MAVQIKRYSVCAWGNPKTADLMFGVRVWVKGEGWMHCCDGSKPLLYETRKEAERCIREMKAERDKDGFKKAA